ncbi:hypothetical protein AAFF_G00251100 [Aldrovandia affinis]|uniref:Uncharacterized protein n=1 Tax=Aldrovandia affinis TaxID=143900 RepID=A0AAD7RCJ9_9TELE|nr:hypothetical protein AAFF_G00251100 [Aldrovandia affinis]
MLQSFTEGELRQVMGALRTLLQAQRTYDLTLGHILSAGLLEHRAQHAPCCRPLLYEDHFSFLGDNDRYYTIHELSAQECGCV